MRILVDKGKTRHTCDEKLGELGAGGDPGDDWSCPIAEASAKELKVREPTPDGSDAATISVPCVVGAPEPGASALTGDVLSLSEGVSVPVCEGTTGMGGGVLADATVGVGVGI